jgi:hypothetical protein
MIVHFNILFLDKKQWLLDKKQWPKFLALQNFESLENIKTVIFGLAKL